MPGRTDVAEVRTGFDPGRLILARNIADGIESLRSSHPEPSDELLSGYLSGWLGSYVVAVETTARAEGHQVLDELREKVAAWPHEDGLYTNAHRKGFHEAINLCLSLIDSIRDAHIPRED
jgi:hypothetical protein